MERCRVAATQVDVRHADVEHNLETHLRLIAETAEAGCDLVVFPELSVTGHNGSPEVTRMAEPPRRAHLPRDPRAGARARDRGLLRLLRAAPRHPLQHLGARRPGRPDRAAAEGARLARRVLPLPPGLRVVRLRPRLLHGRHGDLPRQRLLRELAHPRPEGRRARAAAAREPDARGGRRLARLRRARARGCARTSCCTHRRRCSWRGRCRRACTTCSPETTASTPSSPTRSGSTATARTWEARTCSPRTGRWSRGRSPASRAPWIVAELDPGLLARVREAPSFPLRKRRPETYDELTTRS